MKSIDWDQLGIVAAVLTAFIVFVTNAAECDANGRQHQHELRQSCVSAYETCISRHDESSCSRTLHDCLR